MANLAMKIHGQVARATSKWDTTGGPDPHVKIGVLRRLVPRLKNILQPQETAQCFVHLKL